MSDFVVPPGWTVDPRRLLLHKTALAIQKSLRLDYEAAVVAAEQAHERLAKLPPIAPKPAPAKLGAVVTAPLARTFQLRAALNRGGSTFSGIAYSGGVVPNFGFAGDMAIDLATLQPIPGRVPVLRNHNPSRVAGHATLVNLRTQLALRDGSFSQITADGRELAALISEGCPLQLSVGITGRAERADPKKPQLVNGRQLRVQTILRACRVLEVSLVPAGADPHATLDRAA